jgi:rubredoxin/uncharacterized membrane protein
MARYECTVCGYIYDEGKEGKKWEELPDGWMCPVCGSGKAYFKLLEGGEESSAPPSSAPAEKPGKKRVCNVCGYIVGKGFHGDLCPACGAPETAFVPYEDPVSPERRKILDLHLHPVIVHFPQAFSVFMLFLLGMGFIMQGSLKTDALTASRVLSVFLPLSVIAAVFSGMIDGKARFNRLATPMLKKKILVGTLFLILSAGILIIMNCLSFSPTLHILAVVLTGLCALCSLFLGFNGGRLSGAIVFKRQ